MFIGATGANSGPSVTILTVAKPKEVVAGSLVVLFVELQLSLSTITWPPGFTEFAFVTGATNAPDGGAAWKIAGGSEPSEYAVNFSPTAANIIINCGAWSGRSAMQAMSETATLDDVADASPVDIAAGGVTAADNDDIAVLIIGRRENNTQASATTTLPANYSLGIDTSDSGNIAFNALWYRDNVSAGATGTLSGVITLGGVDQGYWRTFVVAMSALAIGEGATAAPDKPRLDVIADNDDAFQAEMLDLKAWF